MFTEATPEPDSIIVIDTTNDEPDNTYFTAPMSPKSPNEVFKDGQTLEVNEESSKVFDDETSTVDSCISGSMKLLIKPKEPENGQGDLLGSSHTTEDTVAMTANKDLTPSVDDVDMFTFQTGISDNYSLHAYRNILNFTVEPLSCSCKIRKRRLALDTAMKTVYQRRQLLLQAPGMLDRVFVNEQHWSSGGD